MKKRSRPGQNLQSQAFELFSKGGNIFLVAEELRITISESRKYHLLFLQAENIPPERRQEVTEFLEEGYRIDREKSVAELFCSLPEIRKRISDEEKLKRVGFFEVSRRINQLQSVDSEIVEALFFFRGIDKSAHWFPEPGSLFIDRINKLCFN